MTGRGSLKGVQVEVNDPGQSSSLENEGNFEVKNSHNKTNDVRQALYKKGKKKEINTRTPGGP